MHKRCECCRRQGCKCTAQDNEYQERNSNTYFLEDRNVVKKQKCSDCKKCSNIFGQDNCDCCYPSETKNLDFNPNVQEYSEDANALKEPAYEYENYIEDYYSDEDKNDYIDSGNADFITFKNDDAATAHSSPSEWKNPQTSENGNKGQTDQPNLIPITYIKNLGNFFFN